MKKVLITDATDEQLRTFAQKVQLIEQVPIARAGILAALVESGYTDDAIYVDGNEAPAASTVSDEPAQVQDQYEEVGEIPAPMPTSGFAFWTREEPGKPKCPMVTLRIQTTDRPGGNDPAHPVINNSPPLVIQRGKLVSIPHDFYEVLKQAGGTTYKPGPTPNDELIAIHYTDFPMADVVLPPRSEIAAWRAWTGSHELGRPKAVAA